MWRAPLAILLFLLACPPAQATETVARVGDFELRARQGEQRLCMTLRRERRYQGEVCGRIPRSPHRPLRMFPDVGWETYVAAVPPSVRSAETESRSGRRERHRAFAARGFAARFIVAPAPPSAVFVRYLGRGGALLGVDGGPAGYISLDDNELLVLGEAGRGVDAHTEPRLAPLPGDPGRLRTLACAGVFNRGGGTVLCDEQAENAIAVVGGCNEADVVGAIVAPGVAAVRLTLGTGAELTLPSAALPSAFGGRRTVAAFGPTGQAVRSAAALDATGRIVARTAVGTAPGPQPCPGEDGGDTGFAGDLAPAAPPPAAAAVATAGGETLLAADRGDTLCVGLGRLRARTCPPPPVDSDRPRLLRQGGTVAGALSSDAARITLERDRGGDVTVRTTRGPAYTGRWAGGVRFFAAAVGARREVTGAIVRNAGGRIIGVSERGIPRLRVRRTVLGERGGRGIALVRRGRHPGCMTAFAADLPPAPRFCTDLDPGTPIDGPYLPYSGTVTVPCAPRRALAYGRMPDRNSAPSVLLDGDRRVRARRIPLRGEDGWVAFLPDATVRGLRSGAHRVALDLPPASEQCGYSAERTF